MFDKRTEVYDMDRKSRIHLISFKQYFALNVLHILCPVIMAKQVIFVRKPVLFFSMHYIR